MVQIRQALGFVASPNARRRLSIATLIGTCAVFVVMVGWATVAAMFPAAVNCSNPPARTTSIPQEIEALSCAIALVLGRITARPKIQFRSELRDAAVVRSETSDAAVERTDVDADRIRARAALWAQAGLTGALFLITLLFAYEAATLQRLVWPITYDLRCANQAVPVPTLGIAVAFCFLAGRWLWLPQPPKEG